MPVALCQQPGTARHHLGARPVRRNVKTGVPVSAGWLSIADGIASARMAVRRLCQSARYCPV